MTFAAVTKNIKSVYSGCDFERLFIHYKAEAIPQGESILDFCLKKRYPTISFINGTRIQDIKSRKRPILTYCLKE